ncbi:hypothetical protein G7046_g1614 [Stylonectria norvegica]|nr:hypothetical protein G7046_g1614 [Stylonectria norvegica]
MDVILSRLGGVRFHLSTNQRRRPPSSRRCVRWDSLGLTIQPGGEGLLGVWQVVTKKKKKKKKKKRKKNRTVRVLALRRIPSNSTGMVRACQGRAGQGRERQGSEKRNDGIIQYMVFIRRQQYGVTPDEAVP